jgi:hypothetical protein
MGDGVCNLITRMAIEVKLKPSKESIHKLLASRYRTPIPAMSLSLDFRAFTRL